MSCVIAAKSKLVRSTITSTASTASSSWLTPSSLLALQEQRLRWNNHNLKVQQPRTKSSITTPLYPPSSSSTLHEEVYERALQNALAFDTANDLSLTDDSWRQIQKKHTLNNPMKPYPRLLSQRNISSPPSSSMSQIDYLPSYATTGKVGPPAYPIDTVLLHDEQSITKLRTAGKLARQLLDTICNPIIAKAGTTTESIDTILHHTVVKYNAYPSPLNYAGFPKSVCTSVNEVICHGIPDSRPLCTGDVISFDVSVYVDGVHGDNCATIIVGDHDEKREDDGGGNATDWNANGTRTTQQRTIFTSPIEKQRFITARRLVQAAYECRHEGIMACISRHKDQPACLSDIGLAIHAVADAYGYDTVRHYRGHGIGVDFHCAPFVKHFRNDDRLELQSGMVFTIEPMITEGKQECEEWDDDWTVVTKDGGRAAQFEHTVLITDNGVEILTLP